MCWATQLRCGQGSEDEYACAWLGLALQAPAEAVSEQHGEYEEHAPPAEQATGKEGPAPHPAGWRCRSLPAPRIYTRVA